MVWEISSQWAICSCRAAGEALVLLLGLAHLLLQLGNGGADFPLPLGQLPQTAGAVAALPLQAGGVFRQLLQLLGNAGPLGLEADALLLGGGKLPTGGGELPLAGGELLLALAVLLLGLGGLLLQGGGLFLDALNLRGAAQQPGVAPREPPVREPPALTTWPSRLTTRRR